MTGDKSQLQCAGINRHEAEDERSFRIVSVIALIATLERFADSATIFGVPFDRELVEAKLALDLIASADMPSIAWDALEAGHDGAATNRLAALERPTYFQVAELLPCVMAELGLSQISKGEAAARVAKGIAEEILQSGDDPLKHIRDFESLWIQADYAHELGRLGTLYDDVWIAQSGDRSEGLIREWVRSRLKDFLRSRDK